MMLPIAFLNLGFGELVVVAIVALLLYGADLPQVARSWGKTYQEFRRYLDGMQRELNDAIYAEEESPRRLQYYPEFQDESAEADEDMAETPTDAGAAELAAARGDVRKTPATDDAHGAA